MTTGERSRKKLRENLTGECALAEAAPLRGQEAGEQTDLRGTEESGIGAVLILLLARLFKRRE